MKAITVEPHKPDTARLEDVPEPDMRDGSVLVEAIAVGVCGTDVEIVEGKYGWAPPGQDPPGARPRIPRPRAGPGPERRRCGRATSSSASSAGPIPCRAPTARSASGTCAATASTPSAASRQIDGFMSERWRIEPEYAMKVDRLARPPRRAARADDGRRQGVGAGRGGRPARVLGAADGARDRRRADRAAGGAGRRAARAGGPCARPRRIRAQAGAGARAWRDLSQRRGAELSASSRTSIVECTGVGQVIADCARRPSGPAASCASPASARGGRTTGLPTADVAAAMVLENNVVVGSVNANKRHWYKAGQVLAPRGSRVARPAGHAARAAGGLHRAPSQRHPDDIKVVVQFARV